MSTSIQRSIALHQLWVDGDPKGRRASFNGSTLKKANFQRINLSHADFRGATLIDANFTEAALMSADYQDSNLARADFTSASLTFANFGRAYLCNANLSGANLTGADLRGANLKGADLTAARLPHFQLCPEEGSFIAWKKLRHGVLAKLEIPADAKRTSSLVGRKCRASHVKTLELFYTPMKEVPSMRDSKVIYSVGKITEADNYNDDIRVECAKGVHFFMTKQEAQEW